MAKYDTYVLHLQLGKEEARANLKLTVLFEEGDNVQAVIVDAANRLKDEAQRMESVEYLELIKQ